MRFKLILLFDVQSPQLTDCDVSHHTLRPTK